MKNIKNIAFGLVVLLFASCEKLKDATSVEIETDLTIQIPITTTAGASATKSADAGNAVYSYVGNATFSLADNDEIEKYIKNINDIIANGVATIKINGVPAGGTINTCLLKYGMAPTAATTAFNLTTPTAESSGVISITDVAWINALLNTLKANKSASYKFDVSGNASFSVNHTITIEIPVIVEAGVL